MPILICVTVAHKCSNCSRLPFPHPTAPWNVSLRGGVFVRDLQGGLIYIAWNIYCSPACCANALISELIAFFQITLIFKGPLGKWSCYSSIGAEVLSSSSCNTRDFAAGTCCAWSCANTTQQGKVLQPDLHGLNIDDESWMARNDGTEEEYGREMVPVCMVVLKVR